MYRQIGTAAIAEWRRFQASGLAARLVDQGRLIAHEEVDLSLAATEDARAVIRPDQIEFVSYPYEWTFSQLKDAALLTLDIQLEAMAAGWTLKDATPYNIQFQRGRPIHIDSLSFQIMPAESPWVGYRQFCEQFLSPLAVCAHRDIRLARLLRADLEGIPLDLTSALLPRRSWMDTGLLSHIHLHARAQRRYEAESDPGHGGRRVRLPRDRLLGLIQNLRSTVAALHWRPAGTEWADYAERTSYSSAATQDKARVVEQLARSVPGDSAWDLGSNVGVYSRIVAGTGKRVIAFDVDPGAAERHYLSIVAEGSRDILPLVMDIANPSPGLGWGSTERRALLERNRPDLVVALALVHHLAITRNVPLSMVLGLLADIAPWAIVEFVPKEDPMVQRMLRNREDVFIDYGIDAFRRAAEPRFEIVTEQPITGSMRVLFLLERRPRTGDAR